MKRSNPFILLLGLLGAALAPAPVLRAAAVNPATQSAGTIAGRVRNVATGQYLHQARVSIKGASRFVVYTDNFGFFRLNDVPSGPVVLEVFYTDLDKAEISVTVPAGRTVEQSVDLTSASRYGKDATAVKLDAFVVALDRKTDAQAIATNEQRFAPNIKNVMATDSLGDMLGSSVGEFLNARYRGVHDNGFHGRRDLFQHLAQYATFGRLPQHVAQ